MKNSVKEIFRLVRENKLAVFVACVCSLVFAGALFSALAVTPPPQSIALGMEFGDIPANATTLSNLSIEGVLNPTDIFPSVPLAAEQMRQGVTYEKNGVWQDAAVVIGANAKGTVDPGYVAKAPSNTCLRSVSVAIGGHADAQVPDSPKSQAIAIGWFAQAKASNAVAIGAGTQHTNETAMTGDATVANANEAVAVGYGAKATAHQSVQVGRGVNGTARSFKFQDVFIVKDGKLAVEDPQIDTNTVKEIVRKAIAAALDPRYVEEFDDKANERVNVRSHALTTISFTNSQNLAGVELEPSTTRNYDIFFPDTATMREGLPYEMKVANTNLTRLGVWWNRQILKLPAMVKAQEPVKDMVLVTVEEYPSVTSSDWTPAITNVAWDVVEGGGEMYIQCVMGRNLQMLKTLELKYFVDANSTNTVALSEFDPARYGQASPVMDAIPATATVVSLEITDYYTTFYKEKAK